MKLALAVNHQTVLRWMLGLILLWAALSKLADLQQFHGTVLSYQMPLPSFMARWGAVSLPWLELMCGACILSRYRYRAALAWSLILFSFFVAATGQAWLRGLEIGCGCLDLRLAGVSPNGPAARFLSGPGFAFFRATLLLAVSVHLWRLASRVTTEQNSSPRENTLQSQAVA